METWLQKCQNGLFRWLFFPQYRREKITGWNKYVIYDVYNTVGGADVGLCHVRTMINNNTISTWNEENLLYYFI